MNVRNIIEERLVANSENKIKDQTKQCQKTNQQKISIYNMHNKRSMMNDATMRHDGIERDGGPTNRIEECI